MNILFNDHVIAINEIFSLQDILLQQGYLNQAIAVSLNRQFIAKQNHATTYLQENDQIEIISPMQGG